MSESTEESKAPEQARTKTKTREWYRCMKCGAFIFYLENEALDYIGISITDEKQENLPDKRIITRNYKPHVCNNDKGKNGYEYRF